MDVEEGLIKSTKDLSARKVAVKWWDENVAEPAFYDTEVGEVEISRNSIESSLAHRYGQAKLDALTSLIEGFENAVYLGSMPDGTRHGGVMKHYFAYPIFIRVRGVMYSAVLCTMQIRTGCMFMKYLSLIK